MRIGTRAGAPRGAKTRTSARATAATALLTATLAACGGSSTPKPTAAVATPSTAATTTSNPASSPSTPTSSTPTPSNAPSTSSTRLAPALLRLEDLPSGFRSEPLTARNLPSLIKGCSGLEILQQANIADQAQAEWTKGALDDYIDEAIIQPQGETAATLVEKAAKALNDCGSVKVVEEGLSVTLHATPLDLPQLGTASHAWHTTAKYGFGSMEMNVVLIQQGNLAVLVAQTRINGQANQELTLSAAQAAAKRAADFQKS
ncbi:MAG: hypothetical protein HOV87_05120 [Catenulispora sp.]|nr:hypothetical protein [Catenulispora sp.]